jgi:hypothetical protein
MDRTIGRSPQKWKEKKREKPNHKNWLELHTTRGGIDILVGLGDQNGKNNKPNHVNLYHVRPFKVFAESGTLRRSSGVIFLHDPRQNGEKTGVYCPENSHTSPLIKRCMKLLNGSGDRRENRPEPNRRRSPIFIIPWRDAAHC